MKFTILHQNLELFQKSIKCIDTEEKLDLYFYRPVGYVFALFAKWLRLSPTQITLMGMFCGVGSGIIIYIHDSNRDLDLAACLLILAGVFDSADGQLARMTARSSQIGLILDGICDNIVFGSVYLGSVFYLWKSNPEMGPWILVLALIAGFFHSWQCAALDFFNREYLFFGAKKGEGYWNPSVAEHMEAIGKQKQAGAIDKQKSRKINWELILERTRMTWLHQQEWATTRTLQERQKWKALLNNPKTSEKMQNAYRETQKDFLPRWRWIGTNAHTFWFLVFLFLDRFHYYLIFIDIIGLTLLLLILRKMQSQQDQKLRDLL